ncbi:uncharacterized protein NESG_01454 [Nematocida ausubeli]|uniref:Uncharacterized protein n=1 Tax=Nematocida ausubeli (strain ATCC PRA-371 / ERTm2) TaxID=1913371 RepID=A0A086J2G5_NEMA1|nr:uncharacterized protein NESG_01454 [Nematocida ausubeli]KFG26333.1 hypothetical protein NESG_01454 [Nematocida ausubeli]
MSKDTGHGIVTQCIKEWREYLSEEKSEVVKKIQEMRIKNTFIPPSLVEKHVVLEQEDAKEKRKKVKKTVQTAEKKGPKEAEKESAAHGTEIQVPAEKEPKKGPSSVAKKPRTKKVQDKEGVKSTQKAQLSETEEKAEVPSKKTSPSPEKEQAISKDTSEKKTSKKAKKQKEKSASPSEEPSSVKKTTKKAQPVLSEKKEDPSESKKIAKDASSKKEMQTSKKEAQTVETEKSESKPTESPATVLSPLSLFEKMNPMANPTGQDSLVIQQKEKKVDPSTSASPKKQSTKETAEEKPEPIGEKSEKTSDASVAHPSSTSTEPLEKTAETSVQTTTPVKETSSGMPLVGIESKSMPKSAKTSLMNKETPAETSEPKISIAVGDLAKEDITPPLDRSTPAVSTPKNKAFLDGEVVMPSIISDVPNKKDTINTNTAVNKERLSDETKEIRKDHFKKSYNESSTEMDKPSKNIHLSSTLSVAHSVDESNFERLLPSKNEISVEAVKKNLITSQKRLISEKKRDRPNQSFVGLKPEELKEKTFELNKLLKTFKTKIKQDHTPQPPPAQEPADAKDKHSEPESAFTPVIDFSDDEPSRGIKYNTKWVDSPSLPRKLLMQSEDQAEKIFGSSVNTKVNLKEMFSTLKNLPSDSPTKMT